MGAAIRILVVDDLPETRLNLPKLLAFEADIEVVGTASTGQEALEFTRKFDVDIVLIDINMPDMDGIQATEAIKKIRPAIGVVIMSAQSEADYLRRAMQAGARGFIPKPIASEALYQSIREVYALHANDRTQASERVAYDASETARKVKTGATGHIIAVYSPQGGAGVTTIATNMAIALMQEGTRVVLIDGDLQWGDVGVFLNLTAKYTIADLADSITELDRELIESVVVTHASGLKVLLAPYSPQAAERIQPADLLFIIQEIAQHYDYVIVDLPTPLDTSALSIMAQATRIVLVATPTLPAIKNTRFLLNMFSGLAYPLDKVILLMNRVNREAQGRTAIPLSAIENNLKRTIDAHIPLHVLSFLGAVNQGVSVLAAETGKSPALELIQFAQQVRRGLNGDVPEVAAPVPADQPRRHGFWGRLSK